jgi:protein-disulfide isomerase
MDARQGSLRTPPAFLGDASTSGGSRECGPKESRQVLTFRDLIFQNQSQPRRRGQPSALLKTWAGQVGVQAQLNTCLDSGKYTSLVQREYAEQLQVPGTPSIFVGDKLIKGAGGGVPTAEEIGKVIDQAAAQKQGR